MKTFNAMVRMLLVGMLMAIAGSVAAQQAYPSKPIRFIVPFPPGGSTDPMARMAAQKLAERWGQPVIVENRPGGNTIIGTEAAAKAPPDGYTILLASPPFVINPSLLSSLPYDSAKDFDAVATISKSSIVLVVHPSVPANTLQEFIAFAKSKPGQLNYASAGSGGILNLAGELFNTMSGAKVQHIPYKGSGALMSDLIGGQVQLSFQIPISVIAHIRSGKLRAIAITGETRSSVLPEVPTFTEAGLPGYNAKAWFGIVAPAGTPRTIIGMLSGEIRKVLTAPDIKEKLSSQGMDPLISTPEEFAALIKTDIAQYAKIIKEANIKPEN
jgi:tripartite-type tricarboxylate transporter receptor subunit TctC